MNPCAQDVSLLKMTLVPAVILTAVVGTLFILVTTISAAVAVDPARPVVPLTVMEAPLAACQSASQAMARGG